MIKKFLFYSLLLIFAITFFTRNNYRKVNEISPAVLKEPIQAELDSKDIIRFIKDDYEYELTPLYDYELNGLIVHKMDYTWFSIYKRDSVFPMDLCVIWGNNVKSKVYQNKSLKFSQDFRFCLYHWHGKIDFNSNQLSNNHLVISDKDLEKKISSLSTGDQVKIKGQLVNVNAINVGKPGKYDPEKFSWNSSIKRTDSGGGACEVIYVQNIEILKKANIISCYAHKISFYGLLALIIFSIAKFFIEMSFAFKKNGKTNQN